MKRGNDADPSVHVAQMAHQESPRLRYGVITDRVGPSRQYPRIAGNPGRTRVSQRRPSETAPSAAVNADVADCIAAVSQRSAATARMRHRSTGPYAWQDLARGFVQEFSHVGPPAITEAQATRWRRPHRRSRRESPCRT